MSAFLLNPEHIAQLAITYGKYTYPQQPIPAKDKALNVAAKMAWTNWTSIAHRYPETGYKGKIQDYIIEVLEKTSSMKLDPKLSPIDLYAMVECYAYQSCEWSEVWDGEIFTQKSFIQEACNTLKNMIILSDENSVWAYNNPKMPRKKLDHLTIEPMETIIARYDLDCWVAA